MRGLKGVLAAAEKLCIDAVSLSADVTLFFGICPGSVYIAMAILSSSLSLILTRFSFFELFHMADYPTER